MKNKCLSIITNFGCHYSCPYCIVKKNDLKIPKTTVESLDNLLTIYKEGNYDYISISGGGDPMYQYHHHQDYYNRLHKISQENNIPLEMHTSYQNEVKELPLELYERIVFHCNSLEDFDRAVNISFPKGVIKRIVFVVEDYMTEDFFEEVHRLCEINEIPELSFRQRVDENYNPVFHLHNYLMDGHQKKWYYITQYDYNTYYYEGKTTNRYEDFKKGEN